jgi:BirA family biotin operon repressor/biotin-[acetyl-CoA-carboxylase] ligase
MDLIVLDTTDSTNSYLQRLFEEGKAGEGTVVLSRAQTAGRGQRGKGWESYTGQGLYASFLLRPEWLNSDRQFQLNKAIAVAVARYIQSRIQSRADVKWPNDILVEERKVAGILIENSIRGRQLSSCIAGVGVNLNQPAFSGIYDTTPVSLRQLTGQVFHASEEIVKLYEQIMEIYSLLRKEGPMAIDLIYNPLLYRRNKTGLFMSNRAYFSGVLLEVDQEGAAVIETNNIRSRHFHPATRQVVEAQE